MCWRRGLRWVWRWPTMGCRWSGPTDNGGMTAHLPDWMNRPRCDQTPAWRELGRCYEQTGRVATAWATYKEAASSAQATGRADNLATAQKRADALASKLAKVRVTAPNPPPGLIVERDGARLQLAALDVPLPIDPGEHTIAASAPGKRSWSTSITVAKEPAELTVTVPPLEDAPAPPPAETSPKPPATEPSPPPPETGWTTQRAVGVGLLGLGVVGLGAGTYFAVAAKGKYDDSIVGCSPADKNVCNAAAVDRRNDARRAARGHADNVLAPGRRVTSERAG